MEPRRIAGWSVAVLVILLAVYFSATIISAVGTVLAQAIALSAGVIVQVLSIIISFFVSALLIVPPGLCSWSWHLQSWRGSSPSMG